jgi:hypothetical protein
MVRGYVITGRNDITQVWNGAGTERSSMLHNAHTEPELSGGDHRDNRKG